MTRVLMIGLDGFEISLAEAMMKEGRLPHLRRLRDESARFALDQGIAKYSGLAWEEVSSGLSPDDGGRWSAVTFDPSTYSVCQPLTTARPFAADLPVKTVVFDLPYCDLTKSARLRGISNWGAHDPGVATACSPPELQAEFDARFGRYPAQRWIYGFSWPSVARTKTLGEALVRAVEMRAEAARWLLAERLPDWDLGVVVVSEPHSATEPLWHGVDATHPLHAVESAAASAEALNRIYDAVDALVGHLATAFPDAALLIFAMHGMGANDADVPAMALLPELLYRHAFGRAYMREPQWTAVLPNGMPLLAEDEDWGTALERLVPRPKKPGRWERRIRRWLGGKKEKRPPDSELAWMPAARYARFWPKMKAFALPSYYDGRIRINLAGREKNGRVSPADYAAACRELSDLLSACSDPLSGGPAVRAIRFAEKDPMSIDPWEADLYVDFEPAVVGFAHPKHGTIGPVPMRRTGGHTGAHGFLYLKAAGIEPGEGGDASAFDVVPTAIDLLDAAGGDGLSGRSVLTRLKVDA
jgi:predicted AlkP superfamily phosphohydrolase/phosphomutase